MTGHYDSELGKQEITRGVTTQRVVLTAEQEEEQRLARRKANDDWFYSGLRAYEKRKKELEEQSAKTEPN